MISSSEFQRVLTGGWRTGYANMIRKENRAWWGTHRWWTHALVWTLVMNSLVVFLLFVMPMLIKLNPGSETGDMDLAATSIQTFFGFGAVSLAIGTIILAQDLIVGERQTGVMEWILSKPISRPAFLLAKLVAHLLVVLVVMIGFPSAVGYGLLTVAVGGPFPPLPFAAGVGAIVLHTLFYLTLTLMLGVLTESRGTILGVTLGSALGGIVLPNVVGQLALFTPWPLGGLGSALAAATPLPLVMVLPAVMTLVWSALFVAVSLSKFERLEF